MVARRVSLLREYPWSSWRMYAGREPWSSGCVGNGAGGAVGSLREQQRALNEYTETPIRQGHLESPWERLVGGLILGEAAEAQRC